MQRRSVAEQEDCQGIECKKKAKKNPAECVLCVLDLSWLASKRVSGVLESVSLPRKCFFFALRVLYPELARDEG